MSVVVSVQPGSKPGRIRVNVDGCRRPTKRERVGAAKWGIEWIRGVGGPGCWSTEDPPAVERILTHARENGWRIVDYREEGGVPSV